MPNVGKILLNPSIIWVILLSLIIAGIVIFITSLICKKIPVNYYEHFADDYVPNLKARIQKVQSATDMIQNDLDTLGDSADETCEIMKDMESSFISSHSAPPDDSEYSLPHDQQKVKVDRRKANAKKRFASSIATYEESKGVRTLECFADATSDAVVEALEDDLRSGIDTLAKLIDSSELRMAVEKAQKVWYTLLFTSPLLKKAVDAVTTEAFDTLLQGGNLLSKADELVGKATTLHEQFLRIVNEVGKQKSVNISLNKKSAEIQNGKASTKDIAGVQSSDNFPTYSPA